MNEKIIAFEYIITLLINWLKELTGLDKETALKEFNKLKLFKLHFFVSAIENKETREDLLDTFNEFWALPYGPVESYIYNNLNETRIYNITREAITTKANNDTNDYFNTLPEDLRLAIDHSIEELKSVNQLIVTYSAFELVELSHQWPVWRMLYTRALSQGKRSTEMPSSLIRASSKIFK